MVVNFLLQQLKLNGLMVDMLFLVKSSKVINFSIQNFFEKKKYLGMSLIHKIENSKTGPNDRPTADVVIVDSGVIEVPDKLVVERAPVDAKV
jgi:hypothetical protein